jgi:hypothetical protein
VSWKIRRISGKNSICGTRRGYSTFLCFDDWVSFGKEFFLKITDWR